MSTFTPLQLAFGMPGPFEWTIILGIGLLIFGRRLPEVGKSLGKSIFEFKKGLSEGKREYEDAKEELRQVEEDLQDHDRNSPLN